MSSHEVLATSYEPKEIKIRMDDGSIRTEFFEDYVKNVLPNEMYTSWPSETLKAGAVAARTFGWYYVNLNSGNSYHLTEWSQRYIPGSSKSATNLAVDNTQGWRVEYSGSPIYARYQAETGNPTADSLNDPIVKKSYPYLKSVSDSHTTTKTSYSGLCQWGAESMGKDNKTAEQILNHYYTNVTIPKEAWVFKYSYTCISNEYYRVEWWRNSTTGEESSRSYVRIASVCPYILSEQ